MGTLEDLINWDPLGIFRALGNTPAGTPVIPSDAFEQSKDRWDDLWVQLEKYAKVILVGGVAVGALGLATLSRTARRRMA